MESYEEAETFPFPVKRIHSDHPSATERYFTARFFVPKSTSESEHSAADQCVLMHSNKIALITLSPKHPIVVEQKEVDKIEFVQQSIDNAVTGKFKKGGFKLKPNSVLAKIYCKDKSIYSVVACMKSSLIEINKRLIDNPQLLVNDTWSKGYIAIVQQPPQFEQENDKLLLDYDKYVKLKSN